MSTLYMPYEYFDFTQSETENHYGFVTMITSTLRSKRFSGFNLYGAYRLEEDLVKRDQAAELFLELVKREQELLPLLEKLQKLDPAFYLTKCFEEARRRLGQKQDSRYRFHPLTVVNGLSPSRW